MLSKLLYRPIISWEKPLQVRPCEEKHHGTNLLQHSITWK
jgi:hypothetical protein